MMTGLRASLAQARLKVVEVARIVREPKLNLFAQPGNTPIPEGTRGYFNAWADLINGDDISRDHIVIQENFRSPQQFNASDDDDVVDIYFVAPLKKPPAPGVITYAMQFRPGLVASQALDQRMINQVFVGLTVARDNLPTTLAHELLHQLTNRPDIPTPAHIFFPSSAGGSPNDGATPLWARRIQESTAIDARTVRGSLTGSGNKLLRNP